ncbi:MAG: LysE family transporter [Anaerolineae bacterium]|nr:LysE family transporter [Anaerolineae bacterium]
MFAYLLQGLSLGLSAAASPGPFQAFIIGQTLKNGWRRTLPAAFAPLISDGPIIALMVLLLTRMPPAVLTAIQIVGALYVLYLGWRTFQAYRNFRPVDASDSAGRTLWQAVAANLLSPGPYIFWSLLAGPILVRGWQQSPANGIAFLAGFYGAMIGALILLIVLFGAARQLGPRVNRALLGLSALALVGFGVYQLWQGLR